MRIILLICFIAINSFGFAQQTIDASIMHDGEERFYKVYIPAIYDGNTSVPLVFNFHGYGSNAAQQQFYGDFKPIADTENFLVVHPEGLLDDMGSTHFNAQWQSTVDDIGFSSALIDELAANYNINLDRVYSTGMSNGGFMSHTLACELSDKFAAVASVTGSMTIDQVTNTCNPATPRPIMQIHGTADSVVPYDGNIWMAKVEDVVDLWVAKNECDTEAIITPVEDVNTTDGSTAEHYIYKNGTNGAEVEFYKITGGAHTWPSSALVLPGTNLDFNASQKIWEFFSQYDLNGRIITSVDLLEKNNIEVNVFPNPVQESINLSWKDASLKSVRVINTLGQSINETNIEGAYASIIPAKEWNSGIYFLQFYNEKNEMVGSRKVMKQ